LVFARVSLVFCNPVFGFFGFFGFAWDSLAFDHFQFAFMLLLSKAQQHSAKPKKPKKPKTEIQQTRETGAKSSSKQTQQQKCSSYLWASLTFISKV
jgi:hypothetical protein